MCSCLDNLGRTGSYHSTIIDLRVSSFAVRHTWCSWGTLRLLAWITHLLCQS